MKKKRSLIHRIFFGMYAVLEEIAALIICTILYPFQSSKLVRNTTDPGDKPDILCVHGYFHNDSPWAFFRRYLKSRGAGHVNTAYYHYLRKDIPENSLVIKERIDHIKKETGRDVNVLIGHSLGGLICLEYALTYAPKDRLTYVITMGSPIHGTKIKRLGFGPCMSQLGMNSPYVQDLLARLKEAKHIRILTIASKTDPLIYPKSSALLPEIPYAQCEELDALGHLAFLFSKRTLRIIVEYLKKNKVLKEEK